MKKGKEEERQSGEMLQLKGILFGGDGCLSLCKYNQILRSLNHSRAVFI